MIILPSITPTPDNSNLFLFPLKARIIGSRLYFYSPVICLRHNIKDGGYNSTNINKQLSPAQNWYASTAGYVSASKNIPHTQTLSLGRSSVIGLFRIRSVIMN